MQLLPENKPWAILGQSFGGFCCVEYLSKFPSGLFLRLPQLMAPSREPEFTKAMSSPT